MHRSCTKCGTELSVERAKFCLECGQAAGDAQQAVEPRFASPELYTPKHLAEKILTSKSALEGERKLVTVLFADLKGSLELIADRDPEEARRLLDPVVEHMCEAVEKYGGTGEQVIGGRDSRALRRARLVGGPRGARVLRRAQHAGVWFVTMATTSSASYGVRFQIRIGLNSGEVVLNVGAAGGTLHGSSPSDARCTSRRGWNRWRSPARCSATAETVRLAEGYIEAAHDRPGQRQGIN